MAGILRLLFPIFLLGTNYLFAQPAGVPLNGPSYEIFERLSVRYNRPSAIHPELKYFDRKSLAEFALEADSALADLHWQDRAQIQYLLDDNNEWISNDRARRYERGLLRVFYRSPAHFLQVDQPAFHLRVNPILHGAWYKTDSVFRFLNQRGIEARGGIDGRVFFYTNLTETQALYPRYFSERIDSTGAIPGGAQFKRYESRLGANLSGVDYSIAQGYVGVRLTRHIGMQLGHGKHFIGNGYRSLFLSDIGAPAFFLKFNTRVWRFHYQNLFLELSPTAFAGFTSSQRLPKKYAALHYLNFKASPHLAFGIFEATVFNRSRQLEWQYLNPIIFYRSVEAMIGSPDNVLAGFDWRWNGFRRIQWYGQFVLDEFLFKNFFGLEQKGWWGNKWAFQSGVKYFDALGIPRLDVQAEFNLVRPYTWSHIDSLNGYTHYNQPLAHPLWSNFREWVALARYVPYPTLSLQMRYINARGGENEAGLNWGANPLWSNADIIREYDNVIGQGRAYRLNILRIDLSWQFFHNMFFDLQYLHRQKNALRERIFTMGLRVNAFSNNFDF